MMGNTVTSSSPWQPGNQPPLLHRREVMHLYGVFGSINHCPIQSKISDKQCLKYLCHNKPQVPVPNPTNFTNRPKQRGDSDVSNVSSREHQHSLTCGCKWFGNEVMMMSVSYPKVSGTWKHRDVCGIIPEAVELDAQTKKDLVTDRFLKSMFMLRQLLNSSSSSSSSVKTSVQMYIMAY